MKEKIIDGFYKVKSYWKTAPSGYDVPYKEITSFTVGYCSNSFVTLMTSWVNIAASTPLLLEYFHASTGAIFIMTMLTSLIGLLRAPLLSMIIDNSNSPKGKFKPFILWTSGIAALCFTLIPFIPVSWIGTNVFHFTMPAMPVFGVINASTVEVSAGLIVFFVLMQIATTFSQLFTQSMAGIENTISTVAQERSGIVAIKNLLSNLPNSLVNIVMPMVAAFFYVLSATGEKESLGMGDVRVYKIFFPIIALIILLCAFIMYKNTKERVVVGRKHKNKVKFWAGAKELSKNKYFWIIVFFTILSTLRASANIYMWICNYAVGGQTGSMLLAICNMVLNNAFIPGMLLAPMLIKKFGKAKVMCASNIGFAVMTAMQLLLLANSYVTLVGIFFQNLFLSVNFVSALMTSDVLDYQQYKSNKRLEGFWQNYSAFIVTIAGVFTSILSPLFLSFAGVEFGMEIKEAFKDAALRTNAFKFTTYLALIGGVLCIIPMLFYDLNEYKHKNIIRALKVRKAVDNFNENTLEDSDIIELKDVLNYLDMMDESKSSTDKKMIKEQKSLYYLQDEMKKYDFAIFEQILQDYDLAFEREKERKRQYKLEEFNRNLDFEEKILSLRLNSAEKRSINAKAKADKIIAKGKTPNEKLAKLAAFESETYYNDLVEKSRFVKNKDNALENIIAQENKDAVKCESNDNVDEKVIPEDNNDESTKQ